jgi:hypothetical protein
MAIRHEKIISEMEDERKEMDGLKIRQSMRASFNFHRQYAGRETTAQRVVAEVMPLIAAFEVAHYSEMERKTVSDIIDIVTNAVNKRFDQLEEEAQRRASWGFQEKGPAFVAA